EGRVRRAWIGVSGQTIRLSRRRVQLNHLAAAGAVLITEVAPRSPALDAGLCARDIIVAIGSAPVTRIDDLQRVLTRDRINRTASITILRGGTQLVLPIIPSERSGG